MQSQHKLGSSSIGEIATSHHAGGHINQNLSHTNVGASAGIGGTHHHGDGASRILSADTVNERQQKKMITDILNEIITTKSAKEPGSGIGQLRFENDLVTTFFDKIDKLNDEFIFSFVNDLKQNVRILKPKFLEGSLNQLSLSRSQ
jgi:hypothetical protein